MKKRQLLMIGLVLVLAWRCDSATQTTSPTTQPTEESQATVGEFKAHKIADAEIGQEVQCPVMGTKFKVAKNSLSLEYKGKVYYFCCGGCPEAFKAEPEKYIKTAK